MNKSTSIIIGVGSLAAGTLLGFFIGGRVASKKCFARADQEIEDMRRYYEEQNNKVETEPLREPEQKVEEIIEKKHYAPPKPPEPKYRPPFVVNRDSPDYYEDDDYDEEAYTLYADGVLANELDQGMSDDDIERTIGLDNFNEFKKDEDSDIVTIRNESYQVEYEIVKNPMKYEQVLKEKPWLVSR